MNRNFGLLVGMFASAVLAQPARASHWTTICAATNNAGAVQIKDAKTNAPLVALKSGDLVYQMVDQNISDQGSPTFAFRQGKMTEIAPRAEDLEKSKAIDCAIDEPKSTEYPIIVPDNAHDAQLIYDNFGLISDFFSLKMVNLGKHSQCPVSVDVFVSDLKRRELESKGVPLARFCAAMTNNSWFWFDPDTGKRRADYQMSVKENATSAEESLGAQFFFKPIPCFLDAATLVDLKAGEIKPQGCTFRYNPVTGTPIAEQEGRALAKLAVFAFGPGERGGTLDDTEGLSKQSARRLSPLKIKSILGN
jgi:hypothetical protein